MIPSAAEPMTEFSEMLGVQSLDEAELEALVAWANERAGVLTAELHEDPELGPLLTAGGESGAAVSTSRQAERIDEASPATDATAASLTGAPTEVAREDSKLQQPLPPIPSAQPGYASSASEGEDAEELEELDEVELLDDDDLELVEESLRGPAPSPPEEEQGEPEWKSALATAQDGDELAAEAKAKNRTEDSAVIRLLAEEEEVREHDVDLSDLE